LDKNSLPPQTIVWKRRIALVCLLGMLGGLLCSRALASISMMVFGAACLWGISPGRWIKQRWWLLGLSWVALYALSYFWSGDKGEWNAHLQVKLPFLLLPLSFGFLPRFTVKEVQFYTWGLGAIVLSGTIYSLSFLWSSGGAILFHYKYAHVLPTPVYNDHIAFSTAVALTIAWVLYYLPAYRVKWQRYILIALSLFLGVYLHILAAKSGLIALYILLIGLIVSYARQNIKRALSLVVLLICSIALAFVTIPTLRERIGYSYVTWRSYKAGERDGIYSDAGRIISYSIAIRSIGMHPLKGVGAGDVLHEMRSGYAKWYPDVTPKQQLWPHNQWLTCAMAAGIPSAILFTIWLIAPLRRIRRNREGFFFVIVWIMLLVPLMVDVFLEVQFGVAVFLIFLLWQRKAMLDAPMPESLEMPADLDQLYPNISS
jgi:O-antigen ligase